ncbi:ABC transporter substrate-binding protein, partial [Verminephrobacter sp. Larva24]
AKALLAKAGLGGGFTVSVDAMAATPYREIAQSLQSTFGQAGIVLDLRVAEPSQVLTRYRERRHDMIVFVWSPDYSDPSSTIEFFARNTDNGAGVANKNAAWRNHWLIPQLTVETEQASREIDPPARVQRYGHSALALATSSLYGRSGRAPAMPCATGAWLTLYWPRKSWLAMPS